MICKHCREEVALRAWERFCPACNGDLGYPNVRAAESETETSALAGRYERAVAGCRERGCDDARQAFEDRASDARAVISRPYPQLKALLSSDNALYSSFYNLVEAGARRPENTALERIRPAVDSILFPYYHSEIRFAVLSLNGRGLGMPYGDCSIELKESAIQSRTTVFEENSLMFCVRRRV